MEIIFKYNSCYIFFSDVCFFKSFGLFMPLNLKSFSKILQSSKLFSNFFSPNSNALWGSSICQILRNSSLRNNQMQLNQENLAQKLLEGVPACSGNALAGVYRKILTGSDATRVLFRRKVFRKFRRNW